MGIMDQPVQDSIGHGVVFQAGIPLFQRQLAGDDDGAFVSVVYDLQ